MDLTVISTNWNAQIELPILELQKQLWTNAISITIDLGLIDHWTIFFSREKILELDCLELALLCPLWPVFKEKSGEKVKSCPKCFWWAKWCSSKWNNQISQLISGSWVIRTNLWKIYKKTSNIRYEFETNKKF